MGVAAIEADDEAVLAAGLAKGLFTAAEAAAARAAAQAEGRSVVAQLVADGVLAPRTVDALAAGSGAPGGASVAEAATRAPAPRAAAAPAGAPVVPGYALLAKLGEGGMGAVWRARDATLDREVALKVISAGAAADPDVVARFEREARAAAQVEDPHVIRILQVGKTAEGRPFMALELVTGGDAQRLADRAGGRLAEARALEVVRDACRGLVGLARRGLVHRDIKPANIFIVWVLRPERRWTPEDGELAGDAPAETLAFTLPARRTPERQLDLRLACEGGAWRVVLGQGGAPVTEEHGLLPADARAAFAAGRVRPFHVVCAHRGGTVDAMLDARAD